MKKMKPFLRILFLLVCASTPHVLAGVDFYVAPDGADSNPGTRDPPFATLGRARNAVRAAKSKVKTPVNVVLRGGTYSLEEPLCWGPKIPAPRTVRSRTWPIPARSR